VAWVLTYAVHSTLLLLAAWLITRLVSKERLRWHERIWKSALVGGLVSASLQLALGVAPVAGRLEWSRAEADAGQVADEAVQPGVLTSASAWQAAGLELSWERLLVGLWLLGGLLGLALFLFAWRRISDRLAGRETVREGPALESLARLARAAGLVRPPRLSVSRHLRSPATVGVFLPQICVPRRALAELNAEQQEALVAHELAHILRRDPLWFFACGLLERVLFFQPLNRVARLELQECAEFLSDDWAAQATRNELGLARCLTEVATWVLDLRPVVAVVPMASRNSRLAARIARLLDRGRQPQDHGARKCGLACGALSIAAGVLVLPGAAAIPKATPPGAAPRLGPATVTRAALQPESELDAWLAILDRELVSLAAEVEQLGADLALRGPGQGESLQVGPELLERVRSLRRRREQLRQLVPSIQFATEAPAPRATQPSHLPRNPKQEDSR
jgi:beta-lactamase regulating signal transducer with metallopeptidase domain